MGYISFGWIGENREIKLEKKDGVWVTVHSIEGKPDQNLIDVFGSNELPTPWPDSTDKEYVINALTEVNALAKIN